MYEPSSLVGHDDCDGDYDDNNANGAYSERRQDYYRSTCSIETDRRQTDRYAMTNSHNSK